MSKNQDLPMHVAWEDAFDHLLWNDDGLLPVTTVEKSNGTVLMSAWVSREALKLAFEKKKAVYWSRSRQELWVKGETSGNYQILHEVRSDCDGDALLYLVEALGPTCHTGRQSCFSWQLIPEEGIVCDRPVLPAENS